MNIGFIGLGLMGRHMAANLLKAGHSLKVRDLRREAADELVAAGAQWAHSNAEVATDVEIVFTSVPGPADVEAVAKEILAGAKPGTAWFDLSTNSPDVIRRLHAECLKKGVQLLDAPVSGGPKGAQSGRLAIIVGGDRATYDRFLPVIKTIGDGTVAKLAHNVSSFMVQTALAEAFTMGVKAGVEPLALFRALRQGATGRARTFDRLAEQYLPGKFDPPAFALKLAHKDVGLAVALGKSVGVPMKAAEHALAELGEAMARGWQDRDCRVAMQLQDERAGVSPRVAEDKLKEALS
jgi:3-hydroxyisobutyrate dehydrogenase-like beta-hydroxyacid dehydrogenase